MNPIKPLGDHAAGIFSNYPILFTYIYGSVANGTQHKYSDLDIAVYIAHPLSPKECLDLELSLSLEIDVALKHRIESEVRVINNLPLVIKGEIVTGGILIYCIRDEVRIDFETQVRKAYFDFLPVLDRYRHTYRENIINA
jgi:predicted nucleotidyltransferase